MGVLNASLLATPTYSISGGTAKAYSQTTTNRKNVTKIIDTTVTDPRLTPSIEIEVKQHVLRADNTFEKSKKSVHCVRPKLLADGRFDFPCGDIIMKLHPEMSDAEILALKLDMVQCIMDSDFDTMWKLGTIS